jgi:hypothetical protein
MIGSQIITPFSSIALTVLLIAYLMLVELGSDRVKKTFMPFVVTFLFIFIIIAISSIISVYNTLG